MRAHPGLVRTSATDHGAAKAFAVVVAACAAGVATSFASPLAMVFAAMMIAAIPVLLALGPRWILLALFATLPLLQAPTIKIFGRVRVSELLAWLLLPWAFLMLRRVAVAAPIRAVVVRLCLYIAWTGFIGALLAVRLAEDSDQSRFFVSPILRPLLESGRLLAVVAVLLVAALLIKSWGDVEALLCMFVLGATLAAVYGFYQMVTQASGVGLPLLPGTLSAAIPRPYSTFYEPTGFGSFAAVAAFLAVFLGLNRNRIWMVAAAVNLAAVFISLSRAGILALVIGAFATLLVAGVRSKVVVVAVAVPLVLATYFAFEYATSVIGADAVATHLSSYKVSQAVDERVGEYGRSLTGLGVMGVTGVGQGNYIFVRGGAPGWARVLAEGGLIGIALLVSLNRRSISALWALRGHPYHRARAAAPLLIGSYTATVVVWANYINTTDLWLWAPIILPVLAVVAADRTVDEEVAPEVAPVLARGGRVPPA